MKKITTYRLLLVLFLGGILQAQTTVTVYNKTDLNTEINSASAGKTIILGNTGVWTDVQLNFAKTGAVGMPITIKAQTLGSVTFTGKSYIRMGGSYIVIDGIIFANASNIDTSRPVIEFKNSSGTVCNDCKVTNIKIDSYNGSEVQKTQTYKWVLIEGQRNEISYCSFIGKYGIGSIINDNRNDDNPDYSKIHHNYFADRTPINEVNDDNDQDAIRIGNSATSLSNSFTEVYNNFFYNFSGEVEVISNKSGNNKYYNNTFRRHQGTLTLRHGNECEVYNNFFLTEAPYIYFSGGIRVMGESHKIYNNYIQDANSRKSATTSSNATGGINIANGRTDGVLNGYLPVKNTTIINNTFVNCDYGIRIGTKFDATQSVAPDNVIIGNNIIFLNATLPNSSSNRAIQVVTQLTGASSKYENNIKQTGNWDSFGTVPATGNINVTSGLLASGTDFYRIISGSAALDYGLGSYGFLTEDIIGGTRPVSFDAGAEEFGAGGTRLPYKQSDVGLTVGFGGSPTLSITNTNLKTESLKLYPNPVIGDFLNISLEKQNLGRIQIIDMLGRTVFTGNFNASKAQINANSITSGTYILKAQGISKMIVLK